MDRDVASLASDHRVTWQEANGDHMNLDEGQKAQVRKWIEEGDKISDIQKRLDDELGIKLTYMEVRFLVDDLGITPKDPEPEAPAAPPETATPSDQPSPLEEKTPAGAGADGVSVSVDQLAKPGALISGKVRFTDGMEADWYLDQMGRMGLAPRQEGYRPPQEDLQTFQLKLQTELQRMGYV